MGLYQKFKTDKLAETEGIELDYGDGVIVKINRASSSIPRFSAAVRKYAPNMADGKAIVGANFDKEKAVALVLSHGVILGWEGVVSESGEKIPFSPESAVKVLTDLPDFALDIMEQATKAENFNAAKIEAYKEALGNG